MMKPSDIECVRYVATAYSFLVPLFHTMSGADYAEKIASAYDMGNPAIACDVWYAKNYIDRITHRPDRTEWTYSMDCIYGTDGAEQEHYVSILCQLEAGKKTLVY